MADFLGLGSFVRVLAEQNRIRSREIESRLYDDKRTVYKEAIETWMRLLNRVSDSRGLTPRDLKNLTELKYKLMVFADAAVIRAWNDMEKASVKERESGDPEVLHRFERIVRAMRSDLGYDDSELAEGELFGLLIKAEDKDRLLR